MRILNVMFSRGQGGIEQSFLDYTSALALAGHDVATLTRPGSWATRTLLGGNAPLYTVPNLGTWDPVARLRIARLVKQMQPDIIIAHGNRAVRLMVKSSGAIPVIGVAHNDSIRHFADADAAFAVTETLCKKLVTLGMARARVFHVPNMMAAPPSPPPAKPYHNPPVIGTMGRLIQDKNLHVLLEALAILKRKSVAFRAVIAGDGEENQTLKSLAVSGSVGDSVEFAGWVNDKDAFFASIDIFCLPSRRESFGIVLLEAFARGVPVIASDADGPKEIITHERDGLIVERGDASALAAAIEALINDPARAENLARQAYATLTNTYTTPVVSAKLDAALRAVIRRPEAV